MVEVGVEEEKAGRELAEEVEEKPRVEKNVGRAMDSVGDTWA